MYERATIVRGLKLNRLLFNVITKGLTPESEEMNISKIL